MNAELLAQLLLNRPYGSEITAEEERDAKAAGLVTNDCESDDCPHYKRAKAGAATIDANWGDNGASWRYETAIPHHTFNVMEGEDLYCVGIVFALADVPASAQP